MPGRPRILRQRGPQLRISGLARRGKDTPRVSARPPFVDSLDPLRFRRVPWTAQLVRIAQLLLPRRARWPVNRDLDTAISLGVGDAMKKKAPQLVFALVMITLVGGSLWVLWRFLPNPHLARIEELGTRLMSTDSRTLSDEERRKLWTELREEMGKLTDDQRQDYFRQRFEEVRERQNREMNECFALSDAQRTARLDQQIDEMEQRRKEFEARRQARAAVGNTNRGPSVRPNPGPAGAGAGNGGRQNWNSAERDQARKSRLD